jgi:HupE / UreJ protein
VRWLLILILCAGTAHAHQSSIKYVDVAVDGALGRVSVTVHPADLNEAMHLPADAQPTAAQAVADPGVAPYVEKWLAFATERPCLAASARTRLDPEQRFVVVAWEISCSDDIAALRVDFAGFFAVDQAHEAILTVHAAGDVGDPTVVRAGAPVIVMRAGESQSLLAWVGLGMHHIYSGKDHISFVLALLLVVMLGDGGTVRGGVDTGRRTAAIVTAFTVAHSLSLIAASLGWVSLPSRFVESAIAASIVYTAIENLVVPATRWRFLLAFGFGLVHGMGFASALADLLPPTHVIPPLLGFNVGVELGQLTIVLVALPLFYAAARCTGYRRYRRVVMPVLSSVILVFGLNWLISRGLAIPPLLPWMDM